MSRSNHLFHLIKSLSKSEKRSFKLLAKSHTIGDKNNYITLFNAIESQNSYNEELLTKKLKDQKLINNLSSVKVQLYNLILRNLRQFNPRDRITYNLRMQMDHIDILFEKGLYDQCKKILIKAQRLAREHNKHIIIDTLSIYEYEIAIQQSNYDDIKKYIDCTFPEVKQIRKTNDILAEYEFLLASIKLLILKSNRSGLTIDKEKFDRLMQHELLSPDIDIDQQPYKCQIEYHTIWGHYYNTMNIKEKAHYHRKKVLDIIEAHPNEMIEFPKDWVLHARLLLKTLCQQKMYKEFDAAQQKIKAQIDQISAIKKTQNLNAEIYNTIYISHLDMNNDRGLFKTSSAYAREAEVHFKTYQNQISKNSVMVIYFNFGYAYFGNGDYQEALKWINKLIHNNYGNIRLDLQCLARLINLAIHYELGNYPLIASLVRSTNRFLMKLDRKFKVETSYLRFANRFFSYKYTEELAENFQKEIDKLYIITEDIFERKVIEEFDIISWLEAKVQNKTMEEIKVNKTNEEPKLAQGVM